MPVNAMLRIALLIDADNLSGDVIAQAVAHLLERYGAVHFRRAYASPQKVIEHAELFRRLAIRPMVNVPTGKNSTDIALAVDAIDLAICERPDVVAIGSSDSDYAPLAQRLREKGCRVIGIGQAGKTGADSPLAYDEFIDLEHRREVARTPASASSPRRVSGRSARTAPVAAAKRPPARPSLPPVLQVPPLPGEIAAILDAVPALLAGDAVPLGEVGQALRGAGLLTGKRASASGYLKRHAAYFELLPPERPRTAHFRAPTLG